MRLIEREEQAIRLHRFCISHSGANLCSSGYSSPRCSNARNRAVLIVSGDSCSRVGFELETSWDQWRAGKEGEFTSRMRKTGKQDTYATRHDTARRTDLSLT